MSKKATKKSSFIPTSKAMFLETKNEDPIVAPTLA
jgi:hypothetical protein